MTGESSTLTLTTRSGRRGPCRVSRTGATIRQGPHHGARGRRRQGQVSTAASKWRRPPPPATAGRPCRRRTAGARTRRRAAGCACRRRGTGRWESAYDQGRPGPRPWAVRPGAAQAGDAGPAGTTSLSRGWRGGLDARRGMRRRPTPAHEGGDHGAGPGGSPVRSTGAGAQGWRSADVTTICTFCRWIRFWHTGTGSREVELIDESGRPSRGGDRTSSPTTRSGRGDRLLSVYRQRLLGIAHGLADRIESDPSMSVCRSVTPAHPRRQPRRDDGLLRRPGAAAPSGRPGESKRPCRSHRWASTPTRRLGRVQQPGTGRSADDDRRGGRRDRMSPPPALMVSREQGITWASALAVAVLTVLLAVTDAGASWPIFCPWMVALASFLPVGLFLVRRPGSHTGRVVGWATGSPRWGGSSPGPRGRWTVGAWATPVALPPRAGLLVVVPRLPTRPWRGWRHRLVAMTYARSACPACLALGGASPLPHPGH